MALRGFLHLNSSYTFLYLTISQTSVEEHFNSAMISLNLNNYPVGCDSPQIQLKNPTQELKNSFFLYTEFFPKLAACNV